MKGRVSTRPIAKVREARPPAVSRAERGERSREAILEAAIQLFAERGYDGVSLDDITARSGAKRSLILYYYKNKDELWRTAAEEVATEFNATVEKNLAAQKPPANDDQRLRQDIAAWLDAFQAKPEFSRFLVREGGVAGPRLDWLVRHFGYSSLQFESPTRRQRLEGTILRDAMMAVFLSVAALGPLLETSLSYVARKKTAGVYPLSKANRDRLIEILVRMAGPDE
jgi:AcrR family transcriptional regulator